MRRHTTLIAAVLGALLLSGCSVSQDQEVQLGAQQAEQVNAQLPLMTDPEISDYITSLGKRMADRTSRSDLDWHFYVVNAAEANAFALPGGFIYVNRGLIDLTDNEAELAGAIGHEIGHVVERHAVKQIEQREGANVGVAALCTLTNVCSSTIGQAAIQVGGTAAFAHYSRKDEAQADSEAIVNTLRAGIDPGGVPALFDKLLQERQANPTVVDAWFSDHPLEESRIAHSKRLIAAIDPSQLTGLEANSPGYDAMRARLRAIPPPPPAHARPADAQQGGDSNIP